MIVNSAYPYMEKIAPANPVIFEKNVVNYQYQGTAPLTQWGFEFTSNKNVYFYNVNCKKRTSLSIVGNSNAIGFGQTLSVTFLKNNEEAAFTATFTSGTSAKSVAIPAKYQTNDVTIIFSTEGLPATLYLTSATLS